MHSTLVALTTHANFARGRWNSSGDSGNVPPIYLYCAHTSTHCGIHDHNHNLPDESPWADSQIWNWDWMISCRLRRRSDTSRLRNLLQISIMVGQISKRHWKQFYSDRICLLPFLKPSCIRTIRIIKIPSLDWPTGEISEFFWHAMSSDHSWINLTRIRQELYTCRFSVHCNDHQSFIVGQACKDFWKFLRENFDHDGFKNVR